MLGCAQVGPVVPPSAQLPRPVVDFHAVRQGPDLDLSWTAPRLTSDGVALLAPASYELCAWPGDAVPPAPVQVAPPPVPAASATQNLAVSMAMTPQIPSPPPSQVGSRRIPSGAAMPACPHRIAVPVSVARGGSSQARVRAASLAMVSGSAILALYAVNSRGEGAGWSDPVVVAMGPAPAAPTLQAATPVPSGVELHWRPVPQPVRIYRRLLPPSAATPPEIVATVEPNSASFLDTTMTWDRHYLYWLRAVSGSGAAAIESADSALLSADTATAFAPPMPTGVQAAPTPNGGIELSWDAVTARNLAGYNVYRQAVAATGAAGAWEKRNSAPLPTPVFEDTLPPSTVRYAITAANAEGQESPRSTTVTVPQGPDQPQRLVPLTTDH